MAAVLVGDPDLIEEGEGETAAVRRPRRILHAAAAGLRRLEDAGPQGGPADEGGDGDRRRDAAQAPAASREPPSPRTREFSTRFSARAAVRLRFTASTTCRAEMPNLSTSSSGCPLRGNLADREPFDHDLASRASASATASPSPPAE